MDVVEYNILNKKKYFKKRRNFIRRFFLFLFVSSFLYLVIQVFALPGKNPLSVYINNSYFVSPEYVKSYISDRALDKNFFLLSTREISSSIIQSAPILKSVFIRKYIFPELKLIVFLKEKNIWGQLFFKKMQPVGEPLYLTDEADILSPDYLNLQNLPSALASIYVYSREVPSKKTLLLIKENQEMLVNKIKLPIKLLVLTEKNDLEIYSVFGFKIKCGKVDDFLCERILNLNKMPEIFKGIKNGEYRSGYLDLTLENAAVLKNNSEDKVEKKSGILRFLKRE